MRTRAAAALIGLALPFIPAPAHAQESRADRVVIVVLDRVRVDDMLGIPAVQRLSGAAAFGVLSTAGRGVVTPFVGALSISAGTRAVAADPATHFLTIPPGPINEPFLVGTVGEAYAARTGRVVPPARPNGHGPFLYPDIVDVQGANARADVRAVPGLLGQSVLDAGLRVSVASYDGADIARLAPLVVMDEDGVVPWGILMDRRDPAAAGDAVASALSRGDLVAIDGGSVATATTLLPQVIRRLGPDDALIVLAADPPREVSKEHTWLSPVMARGPGLPAGLLTSTSTRRSGVVSNVDVLPTVLAWLGVEAPEGLVGQRFESTADEDPLARTAEDFADYRRIARQRGEVFQALSVFAILAMALAGIASFRRDSSAPGILRVALLGAASSPLVLLIEPLVASERLGLTLLFLFGASLAIGAVVARLVPENRVAFGIVGGASVAVLLVDVLLGSPLAARSILGFTVAGGTRFYGLASEEMGVALAGLFLTVGLIVDARPDRRRWAYAGAALAVLIFAAPPFGAKFGMLLTAIPALAVAWLTFEGRRLTRETALLTAAVLVASVGLAAAAGLIAGTGGSHIGVETRVLGEAGASAAVSVFLRRAAVAFRLLLTFWAWLVAAGFATLAFAAFLRRDRLRLALAPHPGLRGAIAGLGVAALAALLTNDAGAVIVATMVLVAGPALMAELASQPPDQRRASSTVRRSSSDATRSPSMIGAIT